MHQSRARRQPRIQAKPFRRPTSDTGNIDNLSKRVKEIKETKSAPQRPFTHISGTTEWNFSAVETAWRRERDSNPRYPFEYSGFQDRLFQPLTHPSAGVGRVWSLLYDSSEGGIFGWAGGFRAQQSLRWNVAQKSLRRNVKKRARRSDSARLAARRRPERRRRCASLRRFRFPEWREGKC